MRLRPERRQSGVATSPISDETLHDAMARMLRRDIGRMPVVERSNEKRAVGYLGRSSILTALQRYHHEEEFRSRGFGSDGEES